MISRRADRAAGIGLVLLAVAVVLATRGFRGAFLTDPIGPRAMPWLAAGLLALSGLWLAVRPHPDRDWPRASVARRLGVITLVFLGYAALLQPIGFVAATTLLMLALSRAFEGRFWPSLAGALGVSVLLYLLFAVVLGVPLPVL